MYVTCSVSPTARKSKDASPAAPEVKIQLKSLPTPSAPSVTLDEPPVVTPAPAASVIMDCRSTVSGTDTPGLPPVTTAAVTETVTSSLVSTSATDSVPAVVIVASTAPSAASVTAPLSAKPPPSAPEITGASLVPRIAIETCCVTDPPSPSLIEML